MSGRVTSCCVTLLLTLTAVSSVQKLNQINELIQNDPSLYVQILPLLQWLATTADINDNGIRLTFDPEGGDYGSHYYSNFEELLEQTLYGQRYYTLGNIKQECHLKLPLNVVNNKRNSVRIIVCIRHVIQGTQAQTIDRVYITQHDGSRDNGKPYDSEHTYEISTNFLRLMRNNQWSNSISREQSERHTYDDNDDDDHPGHTNEFSGQLRDILSSHLTYREQSARHTRHDPEHTDEFSGQLRDNLSSNLTHREQSARHTHHDPEHTDEFSGQLRDILSSHLTHREQSARQTSQFSYNYTDHHQDDQWNAMDAMIILFVCILLFDIIRYCLSNLLKRWL